MIPNKGFASSSSSLARLKAEEAPAKSDEKRMQITFPLFFSSLVLLLAKKERKEGARGGFIES